MNERTLVCADLKLAISDLRQAGFRLDLIYPADQPHTAVLSTSMEVVRVTTRSDVPPPPGGLPPFAPEFVLTRARRGGGEGRAGMFYRDLVPSRLGGRYVASEISIGQGGEVADWLHFHEIALQILYVRRGWVRVVYEDQGQPFVMSAGDVVLQPPGIRHQVLECSGSLKVVEITAPALHATFAEHELRLPNGNNPARVFGTQHFLHHVAAQAPWTPFRGGEAQETSMATASCGLADLRTLRPRGAHSIEFPAHRGELVFGFVLDGSAVLEFGGMHGLDEADAFVIPPGESWRLSSLSKDFRLLHLTTTSLRDGPVATPLHSAATVSTRQN